MAGFRAQSYLIVLAWLVLILVPQAILGQSELPAIVPAKPAADQLPPQRSFAPLPLNDLRSPSGAVGNVAESQPQPSVASTESALTPAVLPAQEGTTSGVFLRPQAAPPSPASDAPSFQVQLRSIRQPRECKSRDISNRSTPLPNWPLSHCARHRPVPPAGRSS